MLPPLSFTAYCSLFFDPIKPVFEILWLTSMFAAFSESLNQSPPHLSYHRGS